MKNKSINFRRALISAFLIGYDIGTDTLETAIEKAVDKQRPSWRTAKGILKEYLDTDIADEAGL